MLKHRTSPILWIMGIPLRILFVLIIFVAVYVSADEVCADSVTGTDSYKGTTFEFRSSPRPYGDVAVITKITALPSDEIARIPSSTNGYDIEAVGNSAKTVLEEPLQSQLKGIELAGGIKSIGMLAFYGCTSLERLALPDSLTVIREQAFQNCSGLSELDLNNAEYVGGNAFTGCTALTSVHIPASLTNIVSNSFNNCSSIDAFTVAEGNTAFSSADGVLYDKEMRTLVKYPIGRETSSFTVPEGITEIGDCAFENSRLISVYLPEGLEKIGVQAFYNCDQLKKVDIKQGLKIIGSDAFYTCDALESIKLPEGVTEIEYGAFAYCRKLLIVELPDSLTTLGTGVFRSTNIDQRFTIPPGVSTIPDRSFDNCSNMHHFVIPETVECIGERAFYNNRNLKDIYIAGSVTTIGQETFYDCGKTYSGGFMIVAPPGSAAALYAVNINITTVSVTYEYYVQVMNGEALIEPESGQGGSTDNPGNGQGGSTNDPGNNQNDDPGNGQGGSTDNPGNNQSDDPGNGQGGSTDDPGNDQSDDPGNGQGGSADDPENDQSGNADDPGNGQGGSTDDPGNNQSDDPGSGQSGGGGTSGPGHEQSEDPGISSGGTHENIPAPAASSYSRSSVRTVIRLTKPVLKTKNKRGRKIKLSWNKVSGADGYMIYVKGPKDKKFKLRLKKSARVKSITHKGLIKGKKYKYKIYAFRIVRGKIYKSPASKVKTVKVNK